MLSDTPSTEVCQGPAPRFRTQIEMSRSESLREIAQLPVRELRVAGSMGASLQRAPTGERAHSGTQVCCGPCASGSVG